LPSPCDRQCCGFRCVWQSDGHRSFEEWCAGCPDKVVTYRRIVFFMAASCIRRHGHYQQPPLIFTRLVDDRVDEAALSKMIQDTSRAPDELQFRQESHANRSNRRQNAPITPGSWPLASLFGSLGDAAFRFRIFRPHTFLVSGARGSCRQPSASRHVKDFESTPRCCLLPGVARSLRDKKVHRAEMTHVPLPQLWFCFLICTECRVHPALKGKPPR